MVVCVYLPVPRRLRPDGIPWLVSLTLSISSRPVRALLQKENEITMVYDIEIDL